MKSSFTMIFLILGLLLSNSEHVSVRQQDYTYCSVIYPTHSLAWADTEDWLGVLFGSSVYIYDEQLYLINRTKDDPPILNDTGAYFYEMVFVTWQPQSTKILAIWAGSGVVLWDVLRDSSEILLGEDATTVGAAWHPNQRYIALILEEGTMSGDTIWNGVRVFDLQDQQSSGYMSRPAENPVENKVLDVGWHPQQVLLAFGEEAGNLSFWNPLIGELLNVVNVGRADVDIIQWNNTGTALAIGMSDGTAGIWHYDENTFQSLIDGSDERFVTGLAWNEVDTMLAVSFSDGRVSLVDVNNGQFAHTFIAEPSNTISLAWKESMLAIFSCAGVVEIWDTEKYELMAQTYLNTPPE